ncbi:MAG: LEA type 2 family protein [Candidatus Nanosalina sp.]
MISIDEQGRLSTVRQKIISQQKQRLSSGEKGLALLTLALTIGFFGSSAVLMPSQQAATGMFSGELEIQQPRTSEQILRNKEVTDTGVSFVLDQRIRNPNVVEAEVQRVTYEIKIDGQTVKRGVREGTTVLPAKESRMVALLFELDFAGVSNTAEIIREFESGDREVTVEGTIDYSVAGRTVSVPFRKNAIF